MASEKALKQEARESAEYRGHTLGEWQKDAYWPAVWHNSCTRCGRAVRIDKNPMPNGIDVSGEAVALNCEESEQ